MGHVGSGRTGLDGTTRAVAAQAGARSPIIAAVACTVA
jgi:hypothetical protein